MITSVQTFFTVNILKLKGFSDSSAQQLAYHEDLYEFVSASDMKNKPFIDAVNQYFAENTTPNITTLLTFLLDYLKKKFHYPTIVNFTREKARYLFLSKNTSESNISLLVDYANKNLVKDYTVSELQDYLDEEKDLYAGNFNTDSALLRQQKKICKTGCEYANNFVKNFLQKTPSENRFGVAMVLNQYKNDANVAKYLKTYSFVKKDFKPQRLDLLEHISKFQELKEKFTKLKFDTNTDLFYQFAVYFFFVKDKVSLELLVDTLKNLTSSEFNFFLSQFCKQLKDANSFFDFELFQKLFYQSYRDVILTKFKQLSPRFFITETKISIPGEDARDQLLKKLHNSQVEALVSVLVLQNDFKIYEKPMLTQLLLKTTVDKRDLIVEALQQFSQKKQNKENEKIAYFLKTWITTDVQDLNKDKVENAVRNFTDLYEVHDLKWFQFFQKSPKFFLFLADCANANLTPEDLRKYEEFFNGILTKFQFQAFLDIFSSVDPHVKMEKFREVLECALRTVSSAKHLEGAEGKEDTEYVLTITATDSGIGTGAMPKQEPPTQITALTDEAKEEKEQTSDFKPRTIALQRKESVSSLPVPVLEEFVPSPSAVTSILRDSMLPGTQSITPLGTTGTSGTDMFPPSAIGMTAGKLGTTEISRTIEMPGTLGEARVGPAASTFAVPSPSLFPAAAAVLGKEEAATAAVREEEKAAATAAVREEEEAAATAAVREEEEAAATAGLGKEEAAATAAKPDKVSEESGRPAEEAAATAGLGKEEAAATAAKPDKVSEESGRPAEEAAATAGLPTLPGPAASTIASTIMPGPAAATTASADRAAEEDVGTLTKVMVGLAGAAGAAGVAGLLRAGQAGGGAIGQLGVSMEDVSNAAQAVGRATGAIGRAIGRAVGVSGVSTSTGDGGFSWLSRGLEGLRSLPGYSSISEGPIGQALTAATAMVGENPAVSVGLASVVLLSIAYAYRRRQRLSALRSKELGPGESAGMVTWFVSGVPGDVRFIEQISWLVGAGAEVSASMFVKTTECLLLPQQCDIPNALMRSGDVLAARRYVGEWALSTLHENGFRGWNIENVGASTVGNTVQWSVTIAGRHEVQSYQLFRQLGLYSAEQSSNKNKLADACFPAGLSVDRRKVVELLNSLTELFGQSALELELYRSTNVVCERIPKDKWQSGQPNGQPQQLSAGASKGKLKLVNVVLSIAAECFAEYYPLVETPSVNLSLPVYSSSNEVSEEEILMAVNLILFKAEDEFSNAKADAVLSTEGGVRVVSLVPLVRVVVDEKVDALDAIKRGVSTCLKQERVCKALLTGISKVLGLSTVFSGGRLSGGASELNVLSQLNMGMVDLMRKSFVENDGVWESVSLEGVVDF